MIAQTIPEYQIELDAKILEQEQIIAKAQFELSYLNSCRTLLEIMLTAEVNIHHALQEAFGCEKKLVFEKYDSKDMTVQTVNRRLSMYKSMSVEGKRPSWASNALRCAKIIETYEKSSI